MIQLVKLNFVKSSYASRDQVCSDHDGAPAAIEASSGCPVCLDASLTAQHAVQSSVRKEASLFRKDCERLREENES